MPVGTPLALIRTEGEAPLGAVVTAAAGCAGRCASRPASDVQRLFPRHARADRRCAPAPQVGYAGVTRCAAARRSAGDRSGDGVG